MRKANSLSHLQLFLLPVTRFELPSLSSPFNVVIEQCSTCVFCYSRTTASSYRISRLLLSLLSSAEQDFQRFSICCTPICLIICQANYAHIERRWKEVCWQTPPQNHRSRLLHSQLLTCDRRRMTRLSRRPSKHSRLFRRLFSRIQF